MDSSLSGSSHAWPFWAHLIWGIICQISQQIISNSQMRLEHLNVSPQQLDQVHVKDPFLKVAKLLAVGNVTAGVWSTEEWWYCGIREVTGQTAAAFVVSFFLFDTLKTVMLACVYTQVHTDGTDMHRDNMGMFVCWKHKQTNPNSFSFRKPEDRNKNRTPVFSKDLRIQCKTTVQYQENWSVCIWKWFLALCYWQLLDDFRDFFCRKRTKNNIERKSA